MLSPTGYPMRMLKNCPAVSRRVRPACEAYGYLLDGTGRCSYLETYYQAAQNGGADKLHEIQKSACAPTCAATSAGPAAITRIG